MATRSQEPLITFIGTIPTILDTHFTTQKLPTYRQILLSYMAHKDEMNEVCKEQHQKISRVASKKTVNLVLEVYRSAQIPTIHQTSMCRKIENLYENMCSLMKIPNDRREKNRKIPEFINKLDETFPFWQKNIFKKIHSEKVKIFLRSMMTDRKAEIVRGERETPCKRKKNSEKELDREKNLNADSIDVNHLENSCSDEDWLKSANRRKIVMYVSRSINKTVFFILYAKYSHTGYTDFLIHLERKIEEHPIGTDSNFIRNPAWKMNK